MTHAVNVAAEVLWVSVFAGFFVGLPLLAVAARLYRPMRPKISVKDELIAMDEGGFGYRENKRRVRQWHA